MISSSLQLMWDLTVYPRGFHTLVKNVSFPSPIDVGSHNPPPRGFHTLIKNVPFSSPTNVGFHNPPLSKPRVLVETRSFFQSTWISQFYWWSCLYIFLKLIFLSLAGHGSCKFEYVPWRRAWLNHRRGYLIITWVFNAFDMDEDISII